jgi:hypothetical protein
VSEDVLGLLPLDVRGLLDTSYPVSDRPPGTLVEALDLSARHWGPRRGHLAFTRTWEGPGTAALAGLVTFLGTNNCRALARSHEDQFRDLGTRFTVDLWARLDDAAHLTGETEAGLWSFSAAGNGYVSVGVHGSLAGASAGKLRVEVVTTPTRSTSSAPVVLTGATVLSAGTAQTDRHHVRVVRDGARLAVWLDGALDGETTTLAPTEPVQAAYGAFAQVTVGTSFSPTVSWLGPVFAAWLRDGVHETSPVEALVPCSTWARHVRHAVLGRSLALGSEVHLWDLSRFAAHPRLVFNSGADFSVAAGQETAPPAPALVQGLRTWTTRRNRTATSVMVGGVLATSTVS